MTLLRNNEIKLTQYDDTKKRAHDTQIVRAKENLKLSYGGPSQRKASGINHRIKALHYQKLYIYTPKYKKAFNFSACTVPDVANAAPTPTSTIDYNTDVIYTCNTGYTNTGGNLTRTCRNDGQLTGTTPVCTSKLNKSDFEL